MTCKTCVYYKFTASLIGECRRYPPSYMNRRDVVVNHDGDMIQVLGSHFPDVSGKWSCGEHTPKTDLPDD